MVRALHPDGPTLLQSVAETGCPQGVPFHDGVGKKDIPVTRSRLALGPHPTKDPLSESQEDPCFSALTAALLPAAVLPARLANTRTRDITTTDRLTSPILLPSSATVQVPTAGKCPTTTQHTHHTHTHTISSTH